MRERLAQVITNQELGGEEHIGDNGGELEGDTTYKVRGIATTL
jgi:hypothetical protein